jgi:EpsI family protein
MFHVGASETKIILQPDKSIKVNKVIKREGSAYKLILFWYDLDGRSVTDKIKVKAYTAWNAIFKQRTNGTIVMVTSDFYGGAKTEDILKHSEDFVKELLPVLHIYIQ